MGLWKDKGLICGARWILAFKRGWFDIGDGTHPFLLGSPCHWAFWISWRKHFLLRSKAELIDVEARSS